MATLDGLKGPQRVFVDQDLNVLVSCDGDNSIAVFTLAGPRTWTRSATITSAAMQHPIGITADGSGTIAAAVRGAVLYFAANANGPSTPSMELQGPEPMNPTGLLIRITSAGQQPRTDSAPRQSSGSNQSVAFRRAIEAS